MAESTESLVGLKGHVRAAPWKNCGMMPYEAMAIIQNEICVSQEEIF